MFQLFTKGSISLPPGTDLVPYLIFEGTWAEISAWLIANGETWEAFDVAYVEPVTWARLYQEA